jgi:hypothetical protein
MSDGWNVPDVSIGNVERLLGLAKGAAYLTGDGLEAYALLVNGAGASKEHRNEVRNAAVYWTDKLVSSNDAPSGIVTSIARALALVREQESN